MERSSRDLAVLEDRKGGGGLAGGGGVVGRRERFFGWNMSGSRL